MEGMHAAGVQRQQGAPKHGAGTYQTRHVKQQRPPDTTTSPVNLGGARALVQRGLAALARNSIPGDDPRALPKGRAGHSVTGAAQSQLQWGQESGGLGVSVGQAGSRLIVERGRHTAAAAATGTIVPSGCKPPKPPAALLACRHATLADASENESSHTVDQVPLGSCTSSRPCITLEPLGTPAFTRRMVAAQREGSGQEWRALRQQLEDLHACWQPAAGSLALLTARLGAGKPELPELPLPLMHVPPPHSRAAPTQVMPASPWASQGALTHVAPRHASQLASLPTQLMLRSRTPLPGAGAPFAAA